MYNDHKAHYQHYKGCLISVVMMLIKILGCKAVCLALFCWKAFDAPAVHWDWILIGVASTSLFVFCAVIGWIATVLVWWNSAILYVREVFHMHCVKFNCTWPLKSWTQERPFVSLDTVCDWRTIDNTNKIHNPDNSRSYKWHVQVKTEVWKGYRIIQHQKGLHSVSDNFLWFSRD